MDIWLTMFIKPFLFQASWDEPTQTLVLHHGAEPTYLQSLTLQLSDKVSLVRPYVPIILV